MNERNYLKLQSLERQRAYFDEQSEFLLSLYSMSKALNNSINGIFDQVASNSTYLDIDFLTSLSALLLNSFELYKLEKKIAKDIKKNDRSLLRIERKITRLRRLEET